MTKYFFIFGNTPELSRAELAQLFNYFQLHPHQTTKLNEQIDLSEFAEPVELDKIMTMSGGLIKAGMIVNQVKELAADKIAELVSPEISHHDFGLSVYGGLHISLKNLANEIKQVLPEKNRFVIPREGRDLSAVILQKQQISEIVLLFNQKNNSWLIGVTQAFQDVDEWTRQDRGRPFADSKSGMLPVKIARILVNLALPDRVVDQRVLLDPFCGMGTVLTQALITGWQVMGADIKSEATTKANQNLTWLISIYRYIEKSERKLFISDATHVSNQVEKERLDAIVTEPYLGPPFETIAGQLKYRGQAVSLEKIINTIKGLEKLYLGCFKEWRALLKSTGKMVIIFPEIVWQGKKYSVKKPIDNCEMLGYTLSQGPFEYARPQAIVRRKIYIFKKNNSQFFKFKV